MKPHQDHHATSYLIGGAKEPCPAKAARYFDCNDIGKPKLKYFHLTQIKILAFATVFLEA